MHFTDYDQFLAALNGKTYTLDGVEGVLTIVEGTFGTKFVHRATEVGRESSIYRATRRQLGDHYSTEIDACEMSDERWNDICNQIDVHYVGSVGESAA